MEKNSQLLTIVGVIVGAALIISLALIFIRDGNESEEVAEVTVSENGQRIEENQQPTPQPDPDPQTDPSSIPNPRPDPESDTLPSHWNSLTSREKTDLNPFDCDLETHYIRADNGQCSLKRIESPNAINLGAIQKNEQLFVVYDGGPQSTETRIGQRYNLWLDITGIRVDSAEDCRPDIDLPAADSYNRVPYASQHWMSNYIFHVGYYDIGQHICLHAYDSDSGEAYVQAIQVEDFERTDPPGIGLDMFVKGRLIIYTDDYLPVGVPAWEYIGPKSQESGFDKDSCDAQAFASYSDEVVGRTFDTPQHFFHLFDDGFQFHDAGSAASLVLNLTEGDVGKLICIRVWDSFNNVRYLPFVVPETLRLPRVVT